MYPHPLFMGASMEDYITILLEAWEECDREYLGWEYYMQSERAMEAWERLDETFSDQQKELFRAYEEKQNAANAIRGRTLSRQILLLAREIYR